MEKFGVLTGFYWRNLTFFLLFAVNGGLSSLSFFLSLEPRKGEGKRSQTRTE